MTSIYYASTPTRGNLFQTNQQEHESDDRESDIVTSMYVCYQSERYITSAANLINICHSIEVQ